MYESDTVNMYNTIRLYFPLQYSSVFFSSPHPHSLIAIAVAGAAPKKNSSQILRSSYQPLISTHTQIGHFRSDPITLYYPLAPQIH